MLEWKQTKRRKRKGEVLMSDLRKVVEEYKGFKIEYHIIPKGFNKWTITIRKHRFEGTNREEYYLEMIESYSSKLSDAKKIAREHVDGLKKIIWKSQGR
jgi:hypothetical protein